MDVSMLLLLLCLQQSKGSSNHCLVVPSSNRVENAALNKPATQISTHKSAVASNAVDGNKNPLYGGGSCSHTHWKVGLPLYQWWIVDLEREYRIDSVNITNRLNYAYRLHDFDIFVSLNSTFEEDDHMTDESLCIHVSGGMAGGETRTFPCQTSVYGQFVQIYMETLDGRDINICEVTVEGYPALCGEEITTSTAIATQTTASTSLLTTSSTIQQATSGKAKTTTATTATSKTEERQQTTTTNTCTYSCVCGVSANATNLTMDELIQLVNELGEDLTVNRKETSIFKRKYISVGDERQSAETIGFIGVLALCVPVLLIVSFDLINLWSLAKQKQNKVKTFNK